MFLEKSSFSLNYIKQNRLKDDPRLRCGLSIETLCTHEFDIPLARVDHAEGPHVFTFLLVPSSLIYDPKRKGKFWGLKKRIFHSEMIDFAEFQGLAKQSLSNGQYF